MLVKIEGYSISENPKRNELIISLPQKSTTALTSALPIDNDRKDELSSDELFILLCITKSLYTNTFFRDNDSNKINIINEVENEIFNSGLMTAEIKHILDKLKKKK